MKLREAEASLSLKDLRQKVADLTGQWQKHLQVLFLHLFPPHGYLHLMLMTKELKAGADVIIFKIQCCVFL